MRIQAFTILVGSAACNGHCPYCVSKMTPPQGVGLELSEVNSRNLRIGCKFAENSGVSTIILSGKGETTLFPKQITEVLRDIYFYRFPFREIQTNGMKLFQEKKKYEKHLKDWYDLGLTTVAISIVHYEDGRNKENFQPNGPYMNLVVLISYLHSLGLSVRLSCVMFRGAIDSVNEVKNLVSFAKTNKVEQLTITPVRAPKTSENPKIARWVAEHGLPEATQRKIKEFLEDKSKRLLPLMHGAVVYDLDGQNICLSDCLTENTDTEEVRQLIFFPDGHLRYDWQYPGAILL